MRACTPLLLALCLATPGAATAADQAPNIVFIVADDLGYGDVGFQGCPDVPTPHLDGLASGGIRFTDGYVTGAVCSPSRCALMTGRHQLRDGVPDWIPAGRPGMHPGVPTIAGYLHKAGYRTGIIGKWHLGEAEACHPLSRGFDEFYGFLGGRRSYFPDPPEPRSRKTTTYEQLLRDRTPAHEVEYTTQAFGREAVAFLDRERADHRPFFLYLAFNAVHQPMEAPEDSLQRFKAIDNKGRRTYAAMLSAMDDAIGKVLDAIHAGDLDRTTLICFLSDNGGPITRNAPNFSRNTPLRGGKGEVWEGGIRVPFLLRWPGHFPGGITIRQPIFQMDVTATVLALAGTAVDTAWPIDGVDLRPLLADPGQAPAPHPTMCWEYGPQWAIREGDWKLTYAWPDRKAKTPILGLFDLGVDPGETTDVADRHPDVTARLRAHYQAWRAGLGAAPADPVDQAQAHDSP